MTSDWVTRGYRAGFYWRSEEHTSELQSQSNLVCRLLLEKKKKTIAHPHRPTSQYRTAHSSLLPSKYLNPAPSSELNNSSTAYCFHLRSIDVNCYATAAT